MPDSLRNSVPYTNIRHGSGRIDPDIIERYNELANMWFSPSGVFEPEDNNSNQDMDPHKESFKEELKRVIKKRHLNRDERRDLHKPLSDILPDEIPRRACDLKFDDIVSSIG